MNSAINIMLGATVLIGAAAVMSAPIEERRKAKIEQTVETVGADVQRREPVEAARGRSSGRATKPAGNSTRLIATYRLCSQASIHSGDNAELHRAVEDVIFDMLGESHSGSDAQSLRSDLPSHDAAKARAKSRIAKLGKRMDERKAARFYTNNMDTVASGAMRCVQARLVSDR